MNQQIEQLVYERNKIIVGLYWVCFILHVPLAAIFAPLHLYSLLVTGTLIGIGLIGIHMQKYSTKLFLIGTPFFVLLYVFSINLINPNFNHLIFIPFGIVILSLFQSPVIVAITTIISVMMMGYFSLSSSSSIEHFEEGSLLSLLLFSLLLGTFFFFYTHYSRSLWKRKLEHEQFINNKLFSTQSYFNLVFQHAKDAVSVFDLEGKIVDVNPAFEEIYGWKKEECLGKQLKVVPERIRKEAAERTRRTLNGESIKSLETIDVKKDGTEFDVEITLSPIFNHEGEVIAMSAISRDISYKKKTEKMLLQSEKLSLAGQMAAGVAHEIRNPLTVISGFIQMIHNDPKSEYKMYTDVMLSELQRINLIISEFLVLSKPQADIQTVCLLDDLIHDITVLFQPELNLRNVSLTENWKEINISIFCERNQLKQLFINLFKNALEAMPEGGNLSVSINRLHPDRVQIEIADTGIGIPEHLLQTIDTPFYTTKEGGTGLGLMISKKIVQNHNGTIEFHSVEHEGTTVIITFPTATTK
ncbi:ATP-binding protein [Bacillus spongiae]|uniref:histidine kinase n=1 Tax=Bacillus spongiae TaxID=2683610 RepID=A0ABU8H9E4_9BACI